MNKTASSLRPQNESSAFAFVRDLAAELSAGTVEMPAFPEVAVRVRRALDDPDCAVPQIVKIVGAEPALTARLMAMANSAAFTVTGKLLGDLRSAIVRLGNNIVRSAAIAFALEQMGREAALKPVAKPLKVLWSESTHTAALCYVLAQRTRINPDEAFLAGLLHGMGKLYVWVHAAQHADLFADPATLADIVRDWHPSIGKAILENWNLPESTVAAIADQEDRERKHYGEPDLTDVLICAKILAACAPDLATLPADMKSVEAFRQLHLDPPLCLELLRHAELQIEALRAALGH